MKLRQILIAATTSLVVASPAFAVTGSYGEGSLWTDLARDVARYSGQSFAAVPEGRVLATDTGIYEQLAMDQRALQQDEAGIAGPSGPTMAAGEAQAPVFELRTDATIYERISAAQRGLTDL